MAFIDSSYSNDTLPPSCMSCISSSDSSSLNNSPPHYSTLMVPSSSHHTFTPEYNQQVAHSPTYSFSSNSSTSRLQDDKYAAPVYYPRNVLVKQEILSPLPDSFYDTYQGAIVPLLTPPSDPYYPQDQNRQSLPLPPPPMGYPMDMYFDSPSMAMQPCYTPGCHCQLSPAPASQQLPSQQQQPPQQSFYSMSPGYYDPSPYPRSNMSKRQYKSKGSISSDSTLNDKPSSTPRRYKCSLCVKRFTRPSSLATHMHSHTGEKPYKCLVDGCGRRFSVVSNLRRHAKIHSSSP